MNIYFLIYGSNKNGWGSVVDLTLPNSLGNDPPTIRNPCKFFEKVVHFCFIVASLNKVKENFKG